jgi:NADP-dependent 3-hydroxy acid dehydrogenase YdfG
MASQDDLSAASLFNIKGWVAVVTGGGSGLVTAKALAANGVKVYVTGRRADKLKDAETQHPSGGSIIALQMDVTDKESIQAGVDEIAKNEKFVNFLVNNAGVTSGKPSSLYRVAASLANTVRLSQLWPRWRAEGLSC